MESIWVDVDKCQPNNYNPNVMDKERFEALCDFLRTHSAEDLDPIWVTKNMQSLGEYEIVDGEHRWKAAKTVGWRRLRAFVKDLDETSSRIFNIRKNRERGRLDAYKMGKILYEVYKDDTDLTHNGVGKKFGLSRRAVGEYIDIYRNIDKIREKLSIGTAVPIGFRRARNVLRELKHPEKLEQQESEEIVEEMVEQIAPAMEEAFKNVKPHNKHDLERNKLVLNMLLKNLQQGLLFCPVCGQRMMECSHCHTSLEKMKEARKL